MCADVQQNTCVYDVDHESAIKYHYKAMLLGLLNLSCYKNIFFHKKKHRLLTYDTMNIGIFGHMYIIY